MAKTLGTREMSDKLQRPFWQVLNVLRYYKVQPSGTVGGRKVWSKAAMEFVRSVLDQRDAAKSSKDGGAAE